ncbi:MAG: radical SAM family heme chaperone HemW [Porticoccus sp.]|nr:radical SAM family heme chaperone HemW [Porticoccus sp.]
MPNKPLILPPLSLYIHIPWCIRKCPYCDFNSHTTENEIPEEAYLQALINDMDIELDYTQDRKLSSIFFGGGTPSLFSAETIGRIIQAAKRRIGFEDDIEITLEANPGTFEQEKFSGYRSLGVNRLSIGIQSFNQHHLEALGRIHSADQAVAAVHTAKAAGFDNINLDLMHGLPGQNTADAMADLQQAIDLNPNHISWYQLTIEPNTIFYNKPPTLPKDIILESIQDKGLQLLADNGYQQYEVSAYCKEGKKSAHNMNYWEFGDYLGIGAGAHGKITLVDEQRIIRTAKTRKPEDYLARKNSYTASCNTIPKKELPLEFMMNAMRLNNGVSEKIFSERTGNSISTIKISLDKLQKLGLMEQENSNLIPTEKGHRFLNNLLEVFDESDL